LVDRLRRLFSGHTPYLLVLFIMDAALVLLVFGFYEPGRALSEIISVPPFNVVMASLGVVVLVAPWFSTPRDIVSNSVAGFLSLLLVRGFVSSWAFGLLVAYSALLFVVSIGDILMQNAEHDGQTMSWVTIRNYLHKCLAFVGSTERYFFIILVVVIPYYDRVTPVVMLLLLSAVAVHTKSISTFLFDITHLRSDGEGRLGVIREAVSPTLLRAVFSKEVPVRVGQPVLLQANDGNGDLGGERLVGRITNLASEGYGAGSRVLGDVRLYGLDARDRSQFKNPFGLADVSSLVGDLVVKYVGLGDISAHFKPQWKSLDIHEQIGFVSPASTATLLRFHLLPESASTLQLGDTVAAMIGEEEVIFEVQQISADEDREARRTYGLLSGEASQVGVISGESFGRCGLAATIDTPVWRCTGLRKAAPSSDSVTRARWGVLPNSDIDVAIDLNALVSYHTAILHKQ